MVRFKEYLGDKQEVKEVKFQMGELESIVWHNLQVLRAARAKHIQAYKMNPIDFHKTPQKFFMEQAARIIHNIQKAADYEWVNVEKEVKYPDRVKNRWHWSVDPHARTTPYQPEGYKND